MPDFKKPMNLFIALVALVALFLAYRYFFKSDSSEEVGVTVTSGPGAALVDTEADKFLTLLNQLPAKFDTTFLDDPFLAKLKNFSRPLPERALGRYNPFDTIGLGNMSNTASAGNVATIEMSTSTATSTKKSTVKTTAPKASAKVAPAPALTEPSANEVIDFGADPLIDLGQ